MACTRIRFGLGSYNRLDNRPGVALVDQVAGKLQQFLNELTCKLFGARLQPLKKEIGPGAVRE